VRWCPRVSCIGGVQEGSRHVTLFLLHMGSSQHSIHTCLPLCSAAAALKLRHQPPSRAAIAAVVGVGGCGVSYWPDLGMQVQAIAWAICCDMLLSRACR
jgi:hypothetical protein